MKERKKVFIVPARISIKAFDQGDAIKRANECLQDGLIEPGFIEDSSVEQDEVVELK